MPPAGPGGPATKTAPPAAGRGAGTIAAAGLIGGVVGAGLLFAVGKAGLVGDDGARLAALDQRIAGLAPRDAVNRLDARVAAAEGTAKQAFDKAAAVPAQAGQPPADGAAPAPAPAAPSVPADLLARLDSLDQRVAALQEEPGRDQPADAKLSDAKPLDAKPSGDKSVDAAAGAAAAGEDAQRIAALDARVKALEGDGKAAAAPSDAAQRIAALQAEVDARTKAASEAGAALGRRLDGLQEAVDTRTKAATEAVQAATQASRTAAEAGQAQAAEAAKAVDRRLQEQSDRIAALDKSVGQRAEAATVQAALRVVVADRVAGALGAGMPYAEPLASLRRLDPGADAAALAPFAESGAPTAASLAEAFRPLADRIAAKRRAARVQSVAEGGDFRAKLMSMADGLLQVRKVDAPAPEAAADPEGKVQAALDRGDLTAAAAAFTALPPEAQAEAADFGARLKARAQAGQAARAILADAFKALPTPAPAPAPAPAAGR